MRPGRVTGRQRPVFLRADRVVPRLYDAPRERLRFRGAFFVGGSMEEKIKAIEAACLEQIASAGSKKTLADVKVRYFGKNGELPGLLRNLKDLPTDMRPLAGKYVNDARVKLEAAFDARFRALDEAEIGEKLRSERIDITIDKELRAVGSLHPLNAVRRRIENFFISMGFAVADSPEIETDYYNFEALNIPADHPSRDMQDSFYITPGILLRSQTSAGQIRTMEKTKPPIKMISPGRTYRSDDLDATHSPMFHQIEGLVVDKGITMCDLKGILESFAQNFFGAETEIRFRPSYFPFTEPSVEVDVTCHNCHGAGCRICKGTGWIEVLGAGMVNRKVLSVCDIDPDVYTGFAFGMGLDRIAIITSGLDFKAIFENDIRFLKQFN